MAAVVKYTALDVAALDLAMGAPVAAGKVRTAYLTTQPVIQLSNNMVAPFGLDDGTGRYASNKHTIKLSAADPALVAMLDAVDARLVDAVVAQPAKFFAKPMSEGIIRAVFKPSARDESDKHPHNVKFTVPRDAAGAYTVPVVGADRQPVDPKGALVKFARVTPVVKLAGLWFGSGDFGTLWRLEYARVLPPVSAKPDYTKFLINDDEGDGVPLPEEPLPSPQDNVHREPGGPPDADEIAGEDALDEALRSTTELPASAACAAAQPEVACLLDGNTGLPHFAEA